MDKNNPMKLNTALKTLAIGFFGGLIAIVLFFEFANPIPEPRVQKKAEELIDGKRNFQD